MTLNPLPEDTNVCCCGKEMDKNKVINLRIAPQVVCRTRFSPPPPPGSQALQIPVALQYLEESMEKCGSGISHVVIWGPGDPLATPDITLTCIKEIHKRYPDQRITVKTLGLGSDKLAGEFAKTGLTSVEMHIDGVQASVLEKLYAWIRPGSKTLKLSDAVSLLIREQRNGVSAFKFHNIAVSILTTLYPGYNIDHVGKISAAMVELGADSIALQPYSPTADTEVSLDSPTADAISEAKARASVHLPVIEPILAGPNGEETAPPDTSQLLKPSKARPNVAVVSSNGIEIDLHLGQAIRFLIYGPRKDGLACLLETREAPEPGSGEGRWLKVAEILQDCFVLLTASAGQNPRTILSEQGLNVHITSENIEGLVDVLYGGGKKKKKK